MLVLLHEVCTECVIWVALQVINYHGVADLSIAFFGAVVFPLLSFPPPLPTDDKMRQGGQRGNGATQVLSSLGRR